MNEPAAPAPCLVRHAAATWQGPRRSHQDAVVAGGLAALAPGARLDGLTTIAGTEHMAFAVVDGMGGHAGGEDAAAVAAAHIARLDPRDVPGDLTPLLETVSDRIGQAGQAWGSPDMGATVALLILSDAGATVANVGDCRCYQAAEGYVGQLSVDDRTPGGPANVVTQALGGEPRALDVHQYHVDHSAAGATRYLLCSDGLHGALTPAELRSALLEAATPAETVDRLEALAAQAASDNYSAVVVDVIEVP